MLGTKGLLLDGQRPTIERLRLRQPVALLQQPGEVVEPSGDMGAVTKALGELQRTAKECLGLGRAVGLGEESAQAVERFACS